MKLIKQYSFSIIQKSKGQNDSIVIPVECGSLYPDDKLVLETIKDFSDSGVLKNLGESVVKVSICEWRELIIE
jgi:hypothetical protein